MQALSTFALILGLSALVALPSVLAIVRRHPSWLAITIVDILLGWTIVGWIAALVWVLRPPKARKSRLGWVAAKVRAATKPKARPAQREHAPANDNRTMPTAAGALLDAPDPLDTDVYEEWLEGGSALSESAVSRTSSVSASDAEGERGTAVVALKRSSPKAAA